MVKRTRLLTKNKLPLVLATSVIGALVVLSTLEITDVINLVPHHNNKPSNSAATSVDTTSDIPSARHDYSAAENDNKDPGNTLNENQGSATVVDGRGAFGGSDTTNTIVARSNDIVVYSPGTNSTLSSGTEIMGSSQTLPSVNYRIIDNKTGVIATGRLSVISGRFSGKISLSTSASEGRLDIFATKQDGTEFSNVEIPVKF